MHHAPVPPAPMPPHGAPDQPLSLDALRALQLDRLRRSLRHAWDNNPLQQQRFAAAGVHPDDLHSLSDLAKFPFTTKSDLRDAYPFGLFAVPRDRIARLHASSGTTGRPTVVGYTARDLDLWAEVMARSIRAAGGRPEISSTTPSAMACSPAAWAFTAAPSGWAAPWCRCRAA